MLCQYKKNMKMFNVDNIKLLKLYIDYKLNFYIYELCLQ